MSYSEEESGKRAEVKKDEPKDYMKFRAPPKPPVASDGEPEASESKKENNGIETKEEEVAASPVAVPETPADVSNTENTNTESAKEESAPPVAPEPEPEAPQSILLELKGSAFPGESSDSPTSSLRTAWIHDNDVPRIFLAYKTQKSEQTSVRKVVVETLIKEQILASSLPFGTVDTPYTCTLEFSSKDLIANLFKIEIVECTVSSAVKELGLACRYHSGQTSVQLTGTPTKEFSGEIHFGLIRHDVLEESQRASDERKVKVFPICAKPFNINEHPKNLWQDLEVEDWQGYKNEHTVSRGRDVRFLPDQHIEFIAASRRGRSHAHAGKPRDDYFCYEVDEETGWCFAAVADGAGSAKYSRKGSELACETAVKELRTLINADFDKLIRSTKLVTFAKARAEFIQSTGNWDGNARQEFGENTELDSRFHTAVYKAYMAIHEEAEKKGGQIRDYHTTLLCTAFKYFTEKEINGWFFASYWVGDGGAAILRWNGLDRVLVLGEPDGCEFAGQTRFLTMKDEIQPESIRNRVRFSFCDSFGALLLVTDGITDPFFPSEAAVADGHRWLEFYEKKLIECEEEPNGCPSIFIPSQPSHKKSEDLLNWLNFWSKGNHDDRTMLIVKPK